MAKVKIKDTGKNKKPPISIGLFAYFPDALREVAVVSAFGSQKHAVPLEMRGFAKLHPSIFADARARHELAIYKDGDVNAADGNCYHLAQIAWNALAELQIKLERGL